MTDLRTIQKIEHEDTSHYFPGLLAGPTYFGVALAGEVGEACNDIKKWSRGDFDQNELILRLSKELPDVLIYLVMLAAYLDIDLEEAWMAKKEYNNERYKRSTTGTE